MQVNIKLVGLPSASESKLEAWPVSEEPGGELIPIEMPENAKVGDLVARLKVEPEKILVNGADASDQTPLHEGDAIALIGASASKE